MNTHVIVSVNNKIINMLFVFMHYNDDMVLHLAHFNFYFLCFIRSIIIRNMKHNLLNKTKMCSLKQEEERKTQTRRRKNVGLSSLCIFICTEYLMILMTQVQFSSIHQRMVAKMMAYEKINTVNESESFFFCLFIRVCLFGLVIIILLCVIKSFSLSW